MKKIEKERRRNEYNIQSINDHLNNILEEDYYIELGNIDLKVLNKLFSGHTISLNEIYYLDITVNGIGKITDEGYDDIDFQINYLYSLHQKHSTTKFILTCGTVRYVDTSCVECFAPIVLIPIEIDYVNKSFVISGTPRLNSVFIRKCKRQNLLEEDNIKLLEALFTSKIENVLDVDILCKKVRDITGFVISTVNYLSLMHVEYSDYVEQENFFNAQRSILEINDIELIKQYFNNVHPIITANIEQKYTILKAHNGENFVVDGKLATGKTSTAINIIADKIYDGKSVLYVNQDLDNINDLRRYFTYLGLSPYVFDLSKNIWNYDDIKELEITPKDKFNFNVINDVAEYRDIYNQKFHGYPYSYILEKLAMRKSMGLEDIIPLEKNLDREEVEYVYETLKIIENNLSKVDPFPDNVWARLQSGQNALTVDEIVDRTKMFYEQNRKVMRYLDRFTSKYNIKKIETIQEFQHFIEEIDSFKIIRPLSIWSTDNFFDESSDAIAKISFYADGYYNGSSYHNKYCVEKYVPNSIEKDYKSIVNKHYNIKDHNSPDAVYLDRILSSYEIIENLQKQSKIWVVSALACYEEIKTYFEFEVLSNEHFVLLNKLLLLFENHEIDETWFDEFVLNPKIAHNKYQVLNQVGISMNNLFDQLSLFFEMDDLSYENLSNKVSDKKLVSNLKKSINKQLLREKKTNVSSVASMLRQYYDDCTKIKNELPIDTISNKNDKTTWNNYVAFLCFINELTPWETVTLLSFVKKLKNNKSYKRSILIKQLTSLREVLNEFDQIKKALEYFNLTLKDNNLVDSVNLIKSYIPYLEKLGDAVVKIKSYFKDPENISTYDVLLLIESDKQYLDSVNHFKENSTRYRELFGNAYKHQETEVVVIAQTIEHFKHFIGRLKFYDGIPREQIFNAILNETVFNELLTSSNVFATHFSDWYSSLRGFSVCFYQGMMSIQSIKFKELDIIMSKFIEKIDEVKYIHQVELILDSYYKYGLKSLAGGIQEGKFNHVINNISELYLYSTMKKYYLDMINSGYKEFSVNKLITTVNNFQEEEQAYCETNIFQLRNHVRQYSKKRKKSLNMVHANQYTQMLDNVPGYKKIFICDLNVFNNLNDLSFFDLVIIDDAHLSTANKYSNLYKANQVVIFGDSSFQSSATNSLMQRNKNFKSVPLHKRYVEMKSEFGNSWQNDNQYIYTPKLKIEKHELASLEEMIEKIVDEYRCYHDKIDKHLINIIITKPQTRRETYSLLVKKLRSEYTVEETLKILSLSIRIISTNSESMRLADSTYLWYEDLESLSNRIINIVKRNYIIAKSSIYLCYQKLRVTKANEELIDKIDEFIGKPLSVDFRIEGITKIIYSRLKEKGIDVEIGPGYIDLVIKKQYKNVGLIFYGQRTDLRYSMVDDYIYYVNEYKKRGWEIKIFCMEELNKDLNDAIAKIINVSKEGNK